jgi:hypothetical protein
MPAAVPFDMVLPGPRPVRRTKRMPGPQPNGAPLFKRYSRQSEVVPVPKAAEVVSWDLFKWVVSSLLALVVIVLSGSLTWLITDLKSDARDLRKEVSDFRKDATKEIKDVTKEISEARVELVKAIGAVQTQVVTINTKLDDYMQRHR